MKRCFATAQRPPKPRRRAYLAGPMRGRPGYNFPAFDEAARRWRAQGYEVINPAELDRAIGFDGSGELPHGFTDAAFARDLPEVCRADALVVLPGWRESAGARLEVQLARSLDPPRPILDAETGAVIDTDAPAPRVAATGARRDGRRGKGRCDLLPPRALLVLARHFEAGAEHYGDRNWERGMPLSWFVDSGLRHLLRFMAGEAGEDHLLAAAWNMLCAVDTRERVRDGQLPADVADTPPALAPVPNLCPDCD